MRMLFQYASGRARVWRSWLWNCVRAIVAGGFALIASLGLIRATVLGVSPGADDVFFELGGLFAWVLFVRALLLRVVAKPDRLVVRAMFRTRSIPWGVIDSIECRDVSQGTLPALAPVVTLTEVVKGSPEVSS